MAHEIVIPRLGWSMEQGTFVGWLKRDGDAVRAGEPLFELEGEKSLQEIEALDTGVLRIPPDAPPPGSTVDVGAVIGYLAAADEPAPWLTAPTHGVADAGSREPSLSPTIPAQKSKAVEFAALAPVVIASPRAKRVARELGIDWTTLSGSGANGRIRERDVRAAAPPSNTSPARIPLTPRRRAIAQRLTTSRERTVPVTLTTRADATHLVKLREQSKVTNGAAVVPGYQDMITWLVAQLLPQHRLLAGRWDGDGIVLPGDDGLHIGMAVDTPEGLLAPVLRDVRRLSLSAIAAESLRLAERARSGRLSPDEMSGSVFTITNLGAFGIDAFTPVINHPETAILGLGAIRREAVVEGDDRIVLQPQLTLSLTFDHRVLDGAPAAQFLQAMVKAIAAPQIAPLPIAGPR